MKKPLPTALVSVRVRRAVQRIKRSVTACSPAPPIRSDGNSVLSLLRSRPFEQGGDACLALALPHESNQLSAFNSQPKVQLNGGFRWLGALQGRKEIAANTF